MWQFKYKKRIPVPSEIFAALRKAPEKILDCIIIVATCSFAWLNWFIALIYSVSFNKFEF